MAAKPPVNRKKPGPKPKLTHAHFLKIRDLITDTRCTLTGALSQLKIPTSTYFENLQRFPEIADAIRFAQLHTLEAEADRRAMEGWEEERVNSKGEAFRIRKFSDTLLIVRLKATCPERYRDNVTLQQTVNGQLGVDHSGTVTITREQVAALADAYAAVKLNSERWLEPTSGNGNGHHNGNGNGNGHSE